MVHTSTKENQTYNLKGRNNARAVKSLTVEIFEETKYGVVSLIKGSRRRHFNVMMVFTVCVIIPLCVILHYVYTRKS